MSPSTEHPAKTPWHIWVVGVFSLLWNLVGAMDFSMTQMNSEAYLKALTPAQLEYFRGIPFWVVAVWGIGTWGSVVGSLLLLLRKHLAVKLFLASFIGMLLTFVYTYLLSDGLTVMGGGVGHVIFSAVIAVIGVLLLFYARTMHRGSVLR